MFGWFAGLVSPGQGRGGAIGSPKALRALMAQLDGEAPERAVRLIAQRFSGIDPETGVSAAVRRAIMRLDEHAQRPLRELWASLLSGPRGLTMSEDTWKTLSNYYRVVHSRYWSCLRHPARAKVATEQDHADEIVNAARAIHALAKHMLLLHMRYRHPDREMWSHVRNLHQWTESQGHLSAEVTLYPENEAATTAEREMLIALMLEVAPMPNLLPPQMAALDKLLRFHGAELRLSSSYDAQATPFAYDAVRCKAPHRWLQQLAVTAGLKFFGVGGAYVELCLEREQAASPQKMPDWLASTRCSSEDYRDLLDRLVSTWSLNPPQRKHRRDACAGEILVAHDWSEIRRLVKFSELARSGRSHGYDSTNIYGLDSSPRAPKDRSLGSSLASADSVIMPGPLANLLSFEKMLSEHAIEAWTLTDSSDVGLGAVAVAARPWIKVGMMIAYRHSDSVDWQLALVRRLNCLDTGRLTIGMTRIGGSVCSARLRLGGSVSDRHPLLGGTDPTAVEYDALVVRDAEQTLFIPAGVFDRSWKYTLYWDNKQDIVKMERSVERGLNFERVLTTPVPTVRAA